MAGSPSPADGRRDDMSATESRVTFFPYIEAARRKLGVGAAWDWCKLDGRTKPHGTIVTGGVPNIAAGKKAWKGVPLAKVFITDDEVATERALYEKHTGKCAECSGYGETVASVSVDRPATYRPCTKCNGTGRSLSGSGAPRTPENDRP